MLSSTLRVRLCFLTSILEHVVELFVAGTRPPPTPTHVPNRIDSTWTAPALQASKSRPTSITPLFSVKGGKLQHGYPRSLAPYPSNYDRSVIDWYVVSMRHDNSCTYHDILGT